MMRNHHPEVATAAAMGGPLLLLHHHHHHRHHLLLRVPVPLPLHCSSSSSSLRTHTGARPQPTCALHHHHHHHHSSSSSPPPQPLSLPPLPVPLPSPLPYPLLLALPPLAGFNIQGPQSVLEALGVLASIITIHECGHFLAAYLQGIHIAQFSIGFGPTLIKLQGKKVEYSLRAFPLGGFVGFPDDDPESDYSPDDPDLLKNRPILDRLLVVSAGVAANIVFAYCILFTQLLSTGLLQQEVLPGVVVPEVLATSVAASAGLQPGDVILGVDGQILPVDENAVFDLVHSIKVSPDRKLSFLVSRNNQPLEIKLVPEKNFDGSGKIGVQLAPNSKAVKVKAQNLADATVRASKEFARLFGTVVDGLRQLIFNFSQTADKISGPVAIVAVGAEVARTDVAGLYQFAAIVNINLAVVNILPLPALDGGYVFLIALEALRGGKKLPNKVEQGIMSSGVLLLLALGTFLMVRDALNLGLVQML